MAFYLFTLDSPLNADDLIARLRPLVREPTGSNPPIRLGLRDPAPTTSDAPFIGSIDFDSFQVQRAFTGRNSFVPFVFGRVASRAGGSRLRVRMVMHPLPILFFTFWFGGIGRGIWKYPKGREGGFVMLGLGAAFFVVGFVWEARRARLLLEGAVSAPAGRVSVRHHFQTSWTARVRDSWRRTFTDHLQTLRRTRLALSL